MRVDRISLRQVRMALKTPFETSFGSQLDREVILVEAGGEGLEGWGEVPVMGAPLYNEETVGTAWHILEEYLVPRVLGRDFAHPGEVAAALRPIRRNYMAKAGLEGAIWDLYARSQGLPLARALGGGRDKIAAGVSIGIQPSVPALLHEVGGYLDRGYRRIKVKIKPGWDLEPLTAIRERYGAIPLMADANSAYTLNDLPRLRLLDDLGLLMIEQPLAHDDIIDHARLQGELATAICLDESIHSRHDARKALELGSCRIINIKLARVGGLTEAVAIHDLCRANAVPVWCGGLLETGIGRAHNIALASLEGFTLPGDTSGSNRYWERDLVRPAVTVDAGGHIAVPAAPGLGYTPDRETIRRRTVRELALPRRPGH